MTPKKTHEQCRKQSCCCCGGKAGPVPVTKVFEERIKRWAKPDWDPKVFSYPTGLCQSCRARLVECERHKGTDIPGRPGLKDMWDNFKLQNIHVARGQLTETCICDICTARRAHVGQLGTSKQDLVHKKIVPKGEESNNKPAEIKRARCSKCLQEVGKGISHPCSSVSRKRNLVDLVSKQEGHAPEQIVAAVIKKNCYRKGYLT